MKNYPLYEATVFSDLREMTENVAAKYPDRVAISYKEDPRTDEFVEITFAQARKEIRGLGTAMVSMGCREKHCAVIGQNCYGWIYTYFALMSIGAVTVPIDKEWPVEDLITTVNRADCEYVFYGSAISSKLKELKEGCPGIKEFVCIDGKPSDGDRSVPELVFKGSELYSAGDKSYYEYHIDPGRMASIVFTSGTTGKGKGVMLSQTNIVSDMVQGMYNFQLTERSMLILPLHHTFGSTVNVIGHFSQGLTIHIVSGLRYFLREMQEFKPTHLILVPLFVENFYKKIWSTAEKNGQAATLRRTIKMSNGLRKAGIDIRRRLFASIHEIFGGELRMIICGSAALSQDIIDTFDAIGITLLNGYGITECSPLVSCNRNKLQKRGSVGIPVLGEKLRIREPDANGEGEICVKGTNVMLGYYKDPEATAAVFDDEGYFRTGDYGRLDKDGWLYITGRLKNLIIFSNGKNVYPEEIEAELSRIYGVNEVVVYAGESKKDPKKEVIVAEIFPDEEALSLRGITNAREYFTSEVKKANANMVSYKAVGTVKLRNTEFPKNSSKKITRFNIDKSID